MTRTAPRTIRMASAAAALVLPLLACAGEPRVSRSPSGADPAATPQKPVTVTPGIITPSGNTTEAALAKRGEGELARQEWQAAADDFDLLLKAVPDSPSTPEYLFDAGLANEGLELRDKARDKYKELAERFPSGPNGRAALERAIAMNAYLEDWKPLGEAAEQLLARQDIDAIDRTLGLGARSLAHVEVGDDAHAEHDLLDGIDIADRTHFAAPDRMPVAVAQLRFAYGEFKRLRAERIVFVPLPANFLGAIELRCTGLLSAQEEYAQAVRSIDPHWGTMAGYRVGEMYRRLHHDLMEIPAPESVKTERQKQLFYGFMHVRYRVLLEKAKRQLDETITFGKRNGDTSIWFKRAEQAKADIDLAISEERAQIARFPFTEDEMKAAIEYLQKQIAKDEAKKT